MHISFQTLAIRQINAIIRKRKNELKAKTRWKDNTVDVVFCTIRF